MSGHYDILHLERLVAHRELQLARGRSGAYIVERRRKLDEARELLARARERVNVALACACGRTFITVDPNDRWCPECRRGHLVRSVRIIEWCGGAYPPGTMLIQRVAGLTDDGPRVVRFVVDELVGPGRFYTTGRFHAEDVGVRGWCTPSDLIRLLVDGLEEQDTWRASHPNAPKKLRKRGAWLVETECAWSDG